jgi:carboxymethylenebutenolidase
MSAAVSHLRSSGSKKVGIVGFCMGGALSLIAAKACGVDCACVFYGAPDFGKCDPKTIAVPVLGHFGALDRLEGFSDPNTARALAEALSESTRAEACAVRVYANVGHAFANESPAPHASFEAREKTQGFPAYDASAAADAWAMTFTFFGKHLRADGVATKGRKERGDDEG